MTLGDTGPIVALVSRADRFHAWALAQAKILPGPIHTCEAVLTEALFILSSSEIAVGRLFDLLNAGVVRVDVEMHPHLARIQALMRKYHDVPMSFADACLVVLAEVSGETVFTLDSDFRIYRKHGDEPLPLIIPD